jgi:8-oxo-dGTP pyrophosphatase MutT (NUDIX family)
VVASLENETARYDADSVAAVLVTAGGMYVLQRRDDVPGVDFPGFLGLFGGAIEAGETREVALLRELEEELAFVPSGISPFATLEFDERASRGWFCRRSYFEVPIEPSDIETMQLREGSGMTIVDAAGMRAFRVIPYDLCAILMHERAELSREALADHRAREVSPE